MPYDKVIELIAKATRIESGNEEELSKIYSDIEFYLGYVDDCDKKKLFIKLTNIRKHLRTNAQMGYIKEDEMLVEDKIYNKVMSIIEKFYEDKVEVADKSLN